MATATVPHDQRQPIEVIQPAESDEATKLIAFLDAALALPGYKSLTVFAAMASPEAEHLFRLWASAKQLPLEETNNHYEPEPSHGRDRGYSIRSIEIRLSADSALVRGHVKLQFDAVNDAEPSAPTNVVPLPAPTAPQSDAVTERAQPRDLDDAAIRFSLLEVD